MENVTTDKKPCSLPGAFVILLVGLSCLGDTLKKAATLSYSKEMYLYSSWVKIGMREG